MPWSCTQEEELSSNKSDNEETDDEEVDADSEDYSNTDVQPEDKENMSPDAEKSVILAESSHDLSEKAQTAAEQRSKGRKRKRQSSETLGGSAQDVATRRQRIRHYYNGATHCSASAVQVFAMAMQVNSTPEALGIYVAFSVVHVFIWVIPFFSRKWIAIDRHRCYLNGHSYGD